MLLLAHLFKTSERAVEDLCTWYIPARLFIGLGAIDSVPDHSTLSVFKRRLKKHAGIADFEAIFDGIILQAVARGVQFGSIQIVDSVHTVANVNNEKDRERHEQGKASADLVRGERNDARKSSVVLGIESQDALELVLSHPERIECIHEVDIQAGIEINGVRDQGGLLDGEPGGIQDPQDVISDPDFAAVVVGLEGPDDLGDHQHIGEEGDVRDLGALEQPLHTIRLLGDVVGEVAQKEIRINEEVILGQGGYQPSASRPSGPCQDPRACVAAESCLAFQAASASPDAG